MEGPHRVVVRTAVMSHKLFAEVIQGEEERMAGVEAFLVFPMAALHFSVVAGRIGTDQLMADTEAGGGALKKRGQVLPAVGEAVGELKTVVRLDAFHSNAPSGIPFHQPFQEIS